MEAEGLYRVNSGKMRQRSLDVVFFDVKYLPDPILNLALTGVGHSPTLSE